MKTPSPRIGRVNDVIHRELAKLIRNKIKDPRLGMVTIAAVEVTPNMANAKVYVTVLEDQKIIESINVLNNAAGFLKAELLQLTKLRIIPKLQFVYDQSTTSGRRIDDLLAKISDVKNDN